MANAGSEIPLSREVKASYTRIIDSILAASDLNTISENRIRKGIQETVGYDVTRQKVSLIEVKLGIFYSLAVFSRLLSKSSFLSDSAGFVLRRTLHQRQ